MFFFVLGLSFLFFAVELYCVNLLSIAIFSNNFKLNAVLFRDYVYSEFTEIHIIGAIFFVLGIIFILKGFQENKLK